MKKLLAVLLLAVLFMASAACAQDIDEMVVIYRMWTEEDHSAYEETKDQYGYIIKDWKSGSTPFIEITAPQKVSGDYAYAMLPDGTAAITRLLADRKVVEFPSEIDGVTVTQIGWRSSKDLHFGGQVAASHPMDKLIVPETVTYIGAFAIDNCSDLKEVVLPDTLEHLADKAFTNCNVQITALPSSLRYFGESLNAWLRVNVKKLQLPKGLEGIGDWAFSSGNFQQVILPSSLQSVGQEAFRGCRRLTSVTMEEGLTKLGHSMFKDCVALSKLTFPASLQEISEFAFDGCKKLANIKFAENSQLEKVAQGAFSNCIALKSIALPEGTQEIADEAFYGCKALSSITIPSTVTSIGDYAFEGCSNRLVLIVEEGSYAESWAQENGVKIKHPAKKK